MKGIFMPGRLGSERLPNKLILPIGDTCLWEIACEKLDSVSNDFEKCVLVSEEDTELIEIAERFDSIKIIYRNPDTAKADFPLNYVFGDIVEMESDIVMFLNPCLLFLSARSIDTALKRDVNYCESVKVFNSWIYDRHGYSQMTLDYTMMNTKYLPSMLEAAHAFRIFDKNNFLTTGKMSKEKPSLYYITKKESIDVDTLEDYEYAKWRYEHENSM